MATEILVWSDQRGIHIGFWDAAPDEPAPPTLDLAKARFIHTQTPQMMLRFAANLLIAALGEMDLGRAYVGKLGAPLPLPPDTREQIFKRLMQELEAMQGSLGAFDKDFWSKHLGGILEEGESA